MKKNIRRKKAETPKQQNMNTMKMRTLLLLTLAMATEAEAQNIHGTLRGKYEWQTQEGEARYEVRNARVSIDGQLTPQVDYKAEIDLCDEGNIKMLDAYTRLTPTRDRRLSLTVGQMRVPFTIDAHRSPHQQYFANRSFIAKQVGNVRDVGAKLGYKFQAAVPMTIEIGMYNGSGLTNQKDFWTRSVNFSSKWSAHFPHGLSLVLSCQKIRPDDVAIMLYDAGLAWHSQGWHVEAEYLRKHYADNAFDNVNALDLFVCRDIPVRRSIIKKVSPLARYDWMTDHSDGERKETAEGAWSLTIDDYERHRLTAGLTLSLAMPFVADIRINYEKYWYPDGGTPKTSEKDKLVLELMTRF